MRKHMTTRPPRQSVTCS